jgi:hypothetical protein
MFGEHSLNLLKLLVFLQIFYFWQKICIENFYSVVSFDLFEN